MFRNIQTVDFTQLVSADSRFYAPGYSRSGSTSIFNFGGGCGCYGNPFLQSFMNMFCLLPGYIGNSWNNNSYTSNTSTSSSTNNTTTTTTRTTTTTTTRSTRTTRTTTTTTTSNNNDNTLTSDDDNVVKKTKLEEIDYKKINLYHQELLQIQSNFKAGTLTQKQIETLRTKINKMNNEFSEVNDPKLASLKEILKSLDEIEAVLTEKDANKIIKNLDKTFNLSDEQVAIIIKANLTKDQKDKIKPLLETALSKLKKGTNTYKTSKSYSDLLKLELLCKIVPDTVIETASDKGGKLIKGGIKNVKKADDDSVTFDIKTSKGGLIDDSTWSLKISDDNMTITDVQGKKVKGYNVKTDISLEWDADNGRWVTKTDNIAKVKPAPKKSPVDPRTYTDAQIAKMIKDEENAIVGFEKWGKDTPVHPSLIASKRQQLWDAYINATEGLALDAVEVNGTHPVEFGGGSFGGHGASGEF